MPVFSLALGDVFDVFDGGVGSVDSSSTDFWVPDPMLGRGGSNE